MCSCGQDKLQKPDKVQTHTVQIIGFRFHENVWARWAFPLVFVENKPNAAATFGLSGSPTEDASYSGCAENVRILQLVDGWEGFGLVVNTPGPVHKTRFSIKKCLTTMPTYVGDYFSELYRKRSKTHLLTSVCFEIFGTTSFTIVLSRPDSSLEPDRYSLRSTRYWLFGKYP